MKFTCVGLICVWHVRGGSRGFLNWFAKAKDIKDSYQNTLIEQSHLYVFKKLLGDHP